MHRLLTLILLPIVLAATGCADQASMNARYDASLQHWQGATRAELEAAWGKPLSTSATNGETVLTWIVRNDLDGRPIPNGPPVAVVSRSGGGANPAAVVSPGMPVAVVVPITCTTHFAMRDGRVASWRFEGRGCGAPY